MTSVEARIMHLVLAVLSVLVVAVIGLAAPSTSAHPAPDAQNGVAAISLGSGPAVGAAAGVSPGRVGSESTLFDDGAVVSLVTPRGGLGGGGDDLTRVGRWMGHDEHAAMVKTGHVQVGSGGTTSVASPPNARSYMTQARPGSHYVEFDVPTGSLRPGGAPGWSQIPSPDNLMWGKLAPQKGYPVPQSPVPACNIVHVATKSPSC